MSLSRGLNLLLPAVVLAFSAAGDVPGQNLYPQKDAAFAQVAVGPTIETVITLTNRGPVSYTGSLLLSQGPNGAPWNPLVDGRSIQDGTVALEIGVDQTRSIRLTGNSLQSGSAILLSETLGLDSFIEANLTYFLRSDGVLADSVGILPSQEFYLAALPFEQFSAIALALANTDVTGKLTSEAVVSLIDAAGNFLESQVIELAPWAHQARFLSEIFKDRQMGAGKIEIYSLNPLIGTALTLTGGQLSSLPLQPSPSAYAFRMTAGDGTEFEGDLALWAEGFFVKGYLVVYRTDGADLETSYVTLVNGQLVDRFLDLSFFAERRAFFGDDGIPPEDKGLSVYLFNPDFAFEDTTVNGDWTLFFLTDRTSLTGSYSLERITP